LDLPTAKPDSRKGVDLALAAIASGILLGLTAGAFGEAPFVAKTTPWSRRVVTWLVAAGAVALYFVLSLTVFSDEYFLELTASFTLCGLVGIVIGNFVFLDS
jgi:hypothetical protein